MSLFGTSPPEVAHTSSSANPTTLFGDDTATASTLTPSLFAEDGGDRSPWIMPTPKKAAGRELVKNLLPATDVPESYIDSYDAVLDSKDRVGAGIGLTSIKNILASSGLSAADQAKVLNLVVPGGQENVNGLGRSEFNVLLALIGLGQEGDDITLDGVDERRRRLPQPKISYFNELKGQGREEQPHSRPSQAAITPPSGTSPRETNSSRPRRMRQDSLGDPESDPWSTPTTSKALAPPSPGDASKPNGPTQNGLPSSAPDFSHRTTSAYSSQGEPVSDGNNAASEGARSTGGDGEWNSYNGGSRGGFSDQPALGGGFGQAGDDQGDRGSSNQAGSARPSAGAPHGTSEVVTITMLPDKEGMFMFQHRNYEVKSVRRGSTVVRRYSDFVWLLDCLHKRYPFRRLPLLPPKRVAVNGTHLAADSSSFLEKRRRGLVRFTNALIQHPILSQEQLVVMFLTVPTELAVWRKQATISVTEEFTDKRLPPDLEDSLPPSLTETFDTVRAGVRRSAEIYIQLCQLLERLAKRNQGLAADSLRFSLALTSLTESSMDTYAIDTNEVPLLNEGINATAKHLSTSQSLLEDEAKAWDEGVLEDLKKERDCLVGMRDMFDRRDRLARDNIAQLERRIETSEAKLEGLRQRPEGTVKQADVEKVENSIIRDKESIVAQHARGVFIRECVRDEIRYFSGASIWHVGRLLQDWSAERVKFSELQAGCWRRLQEEVESMPVGE